jgi:Methyltransferase domain
MIKKKFSMPVEAETSLDSHSRRRTLLALSATLLPSLAQAQTSSPTETGSPGTPPADPAEEVPYVQTPPLLVRRMLQLAEVTRRDVLWDLGSGDGRIVIAAAKDFGAQGVGYEIDPALVRESRERARKAGVIQRTQFVEKDLFALAFSRPSVVTLYLLPEFNMKLRPLLLAQMRPGSRVVSHEWDMGDWKADETLLFPSPEKPHGTSKQHTIMLWVIPAQVAGRWRVNATGDTNHVARGLELALDQHLQQISAAAPRGRVLWANLRGTRLSVAWSEGAARWALRGDVVGNQWRGEIEQIGNWANSSNKIPVRFDAMRLA